jgi:soluble lytic murein transglycosylase-like protein
MRIADEVAAIRRRVESIEAGPPELGDFRRALDAVSVRRGEDRAPASRDEPASGIDRLVETNAQAFRVDPALVEAVIANESAFDPNATSRSGARGLMQLMPETAASLGVSDAYDPAQNVRAGTQYLRALLDRFGDAKLALAAYNAGPNAVARYESVPPYRETQDYVHRVWARYLALKARP